MPSLMRSACLAWPPALSLTRRTAVYGPVRTVVWEGRAGNRCPYPDLFHSFNDDPLGVDLDPSRGSILRERLS